MSFSDLTFLFYFLPLFFAVYCILPFRFKNAALVLGSFAFYFIGAGARDTLLLSGVLLLHYALARAMAGKEVRTRKALLIIALAADLFCLVYFKYAAFILENLGKLTGTVFSLVELALPLGVSFYLFQSAGYLIDVYRGEEAEKNLIDYAAFTIAFPQLTMGPILRCREWRGALKERTITREDVFSGFELFVVGLCFKVLLADQLAPLWASLERIGYEYLSTPLAWLGAVSYSLQLYFDFSGYSLMAMGLGQMLALPVPRNFDLPYTARSVSEFYRRWHITLGTWFRDYVYIPLGGSRNGNARTVLSLTVVWFFTGLWHGASWNFVLWGDAAWIHPARKVLYRRFSQGAQSALARLSPLRHPADVGHFPHHALKGRRRVFFPPVPAVRRTQRHLRAGCAQAALVLLVAAAARHLLLSAAAAPLL